MATAHLCSGAFVERRTSNLSGCLFFFFYSLNTLLSGSLLLGVRDNNLSTWYQVSCSPEKAKWPVSEQTLAVPTPPFVFLQLCCIFQPAPSSFPNTTPICFVERQFTFHHIVRRNARQEGRKRTKQLFPWQRSKPPPQNTQSNYYFCLIWGHHNGWTVIGVSLIDI